VFLLKKKLAKGVGLISA